MEFIKKTEHFFSQLQYSLVIEPELIRQTDSGLISLILEPSIFFQIVSNYKIEYPFFYENKIIELKTLMKNENLPQNDALIIIENYRKLYWSSPPTFFEPEIDKIRQAIKHLNKKVGEEEKTFLREIKELQDYLINKRESMFSELVTKISKQTTPPHPNIKVVKENHTKVKNPTPDQKKFLKAFVINLTDGHKITYAIETACESTKYSKRQGQNLYREVREGSLKYEPLSEVLSERKQSNNNDIIT